MEVNLSEPLKEVSARLSEQLDLEIDKNKRNFESKKHFFTAEHFIEIKKMVEDEEKRLLERGYKGLYCRFLENVNAGIDKLVFAEKIEERKTQIIEKAPFASLLKIADLLPKKHRESLIQEISDMRLEYYESLAEKNIWRARFIVGFYYIGLSWSITMWISDKIKEIVGIIPKKN